MRAGLLVAGAAGALALLALLATEANDARACGRGVSYGFNGTDLAIVGGGMVLGTTDLIFTVHDAARAPVSSEHDVGWSKAETYLTFPQVALGAALAAANPEAADVFIPLSAWPASLMVHGFYATNGTYGERYTFPLGVVGVMDVGLMGYSSIATLAGNRPSPAYGIGELVTGLAQVCFGLGFANRASGHVLRDSLLVTLVPTALMIHGFFLSKEPEPPAPATKPTTTGASTIVPSMLVQTTTGVAPGFALTGTF